VATCIVIAVVLCGCFSVKAPDGPFVTFGEGDDSAGSPAEVAGEIRAFLERARDDGDITPSQYRRLREKLKKWRGRDA